MRTPVRRRLALFALCLGVASCASVPLSTLMRMSSFSEEQFVGLRPVRRYALAPAAIAALIAFTLQLNLFFDPVRVPWRGVHGSYQQTRPQPAFPGRCAARSGALQIRDTRPHANSPCRNQRGGSASLS